MTPGLEAVVVERYARRWDPGVRGICAGVGRKKEDAEQRADDDADEPAHLPRDYYPAPARTMPFFSSGPHGGRRAGLTGLDLLVKLSAS